MSARFIARPTRLDLVLSWKRTATALLIAGGSALLLSGCASGGAASTGAAPQITAASGSATVAATTSNSTLRVAPDGMQAATSASATTAATSSVGPTGPSAPSANGSSTASSSNQVASSVVVTYAGWNASAKQVEVSAYVAGLTTGTGRCVLTLTTSGAPAQTAQNRALPDISTTQCGMLVIPGAQLTSGTWTALVRFTSADSSSTSKPVAVTVVA